MVRTCERILVFFLLGLSAYRNPSVAGYMNDTIDQIDTNLTEMADYKVEYVGPQGNLLEGPHWLQDQQKLLFVDIKGMKVHILDPKTKALETAQFASTVGFAVPHVNGGYVAGVGKKLLHFNMSEPENATVIAEVDHGLNNRFNDGKCDPAGRLWGGTCSLDQTLDTPLNAGSLFKFGHDGRVSDMAGDYNIANGLAWSPDNKSFFHAESLFPSAVYKFDFENTRGNVSNRRVLVDFSGTDNCRPDGMTIDSDGNLWLVLHGQAKIAQIHPETGAILREIKLPLDNVTSCCFGGPNLDELYVTSMTWDESDPPEAGSLMKVTGLGVRGLPATIYKGITFFFLAP